MKNKIVVRLSGKTRSSQFKACNPKCVCVTVCLLNAFVV